MKTYYYCIKCSKECDKNICSNQECAEKLKIKFFAADIIDLLKSRMKQEKFYKDIQYFREEYVRTRVIIKDHFDTDIYNKLAYPLTKYPNNVSFTINTDGICPYLSYKCQI
jgi:hypothetical protein